MNGMNEQDAEQPTGGQPPTWLLGDTGGRKAGRPAESRPPVWMFYYDGDDADDLSRAVAAVPTLSDVPGIRRVDNVARAHAPGDGRGGNAGRRKGSLWVIDRRALDLTLEHESAGWPVWRLACMLHLRGLVACHDTHDPVAPMASGCGNRIEDLTYAMCVRALQAQRAEAVLRTMLGRTPVPGRGAYLEAARTYDRDLWQERNPEYVEMHEARRDALGPDYDEEADKACMVLESEMDGLGLLNETDSLGHMVAFALQGRP